MGQNMTDQPERDEHAENQAIDWLFAVRAYGLERANEMFPPESDETA